MPPANLHRSPRFNSSCNGSHTPPSSRSPRRYNNDIRKEGGGGTDFAAFASAAVSNESVRSPQPQQQQNPSDRKHVVPHTLQAIITDDRDHGKEYSRTPMNSKNKKKKPTISSPGQPPTPAMTNNLRFDFEEDPPPQSPGLNTIQIHHSSHFDHDDEYTSKIGCFRAMISCYPGKTKESPPPPINVLPMSAPVSPHRCGSPPDSGRRLSEPGPVLDQKMFMRSSSMKVLQRKGSSNGRSQQQQPRIMFSTSSGQLKPPPLEMKLQCSLDDLCFGCVKQISVSRHFVTFAGHMSQKEEVLTVTVEPGWTKGTKITFPGANNDKEDGHHFYSSDIVFVVVEDNHKFLKRSSNKEVDLEIELDVPLLDALTGCDVNIPLLRDGHISLSIEDEIVTPGLEKVFRGQGMPYRHDPSSRGDLRVKFNVEFPRKLTDAQRLEISKILSDS